MRLGPRGICSAQVGCEPSVSFSPWSCPLSRFLPLAPQVRLLVEVEEKGQEAGRVQEDGHVEPVGEGALSKEIVGGVGSNGHELSLGRGGTRGKRRRQRVRSKGTGRCSFELPVIPWGPQGSEQGRTRKPHPRHSCSRC